jgi:hypothetical protein
MFTMIFFTAFIDFMAYGLILLVAFFLMNAFTAGTQVTGSGNFFYLY